MLCPARGGPGGSAAPEAGALVATGQPRAGGGAVSACSPPPAARTATAGEVQQLPRGAELEQRHGATGRGLRARGAVAGDLPAPSPGRRRRRGRPIVRRKVEAEEALARGGQREGRPTHTPHHARHTRGGTARLAHAPRAAAGGIRPAGLLRLWAGGADNMQRNGRSSSPSCRSLPSLLSSCPLLVTAKKILGGVAPPVRPEAVGSVLVRARARVAGSVDSRGRAGGSPSNFSLSLTFLSPFFLSL